MQDRSLSALERNKKIQDMMSGRAGLLAAKEPAAWPFVVDPTRKRKGANEAETYYMPTEIATKHYLNINNLHT